MWSLKRSSRFLAYSLKPGFLVLSVTTVASRSHFRVRILNCAGIPYTVAGTCSSRNKTELVSRASGASRGRAAN